MLCSHETFFWLWLRESVSCRNQSSMNFRSARPFEGQNWLYWNWKRSCLPSSFLLKTFYSQLSRILKHVPTSQPNFFFLKVVPLTTTVVDLYRGTLPILSCFVGLRHVKYNVFRNESVYYSAMSGRYHQFWTHYIFSLYYQLLFYFFHCNAHRN